MDKIVISSSEVAQTEIATETPARLESKLPPPVPTWAKWLLSPLVLVLPLLCVVAIVLRAAMRRLPPRNRYAWTALLTTLLTVSGLVTSAATVVFYSIAPLPPLTQPGLSMLDEKDEFPSLPSVEAMSAKDVSEKLKPLVAVISPAQRTWLSHQWIPSASFGAGTLLQANADGYLFVTARHVVDGAAWRVAHGTHALIAMSSGTWGTAEVVGRHRTLDLLLLWVPRESGDGKFVQPLAKTGPRIEGENIFVIGHPEGLRFTLSTGIVSRLQGSVVQISAPVSPGNSGGPVFDDHGALVAVVTSMVDRNGDPNAENLNFAVRVDSLMEDSGWEFVGNGQRRLREYLAQDVTHGNTVQVGGKQ
jgi:S1-C subfamily serine protease